MLVSILTRLSVVLLLAMLVGVVSVIGIDRFRDGLSTWRETVRAITPIGLTLATVLSINKISRQALVDISSQYGLRLGGLFYDIEGRFILLFQSIGNEWTAAFYSYIYIYAYVFLLAFPVIMYFVLSDTRTIRGLLASYTLNYTIGAVLYVVVHAFGPRQYIGEDVRWMLFDFRPSYQLLTAEVNTYTNVFPSLHTSLSATVLLYAVRTHDRFPRWTPIAAFIAVNVWIATMYLGIHWAIDVVAGLVLAWGSVALADRLVGRFDVDRFFDPVWLRVDRLSKRIGDRVNRRFRRFGGG
ncbi:phosphatase PAP2 family protein [Halovivax limisalsi]|uniref:phosphatase PAP2 family protein n=1 Tax=Halovivax limisalsi TaxID=1453760 RepID=UPI001FFDA516|nr:phosphatase PAP2 family protein [Halovivax limisalsi]